MSSGSVPHRVSNVALTGDIEARTESPLNKVLVGDVFKMFLRDQRESV